MPAGRGILAFRNKSRVPVPQKKKKKRTVSVRKKPRRAKVKSAAKRVSRATSLSAIAGLLAQAPLLRGAPVTLARRLLTTCRRRELVERELLMLPNQPNHSLYLLLNGRLHVLLGEAQDTIVQMHPGACVGEVSVIDGAGVTAPVVAAEPSTLLAIDTRAFWKAAKRYPVIARNLLEIMAQRVRKTNNVLRASLRAHDQQGQLARIDILTSTRNRRWLDENLPKCLATARDDGQILVIGMFDIDHFKKYNDNWGHAAGDAALKAVASAVHDCLRPDDRLARYGGEEFCLIWLVSKPTEIAPLAQKALTAIAEARIKGPTGDVLPSVTASLGLASAHADDSPESLLRRADQALYQAKRDGRNRFVFNKTAAAD